MKRFILLVATCVTALAQTAQYPTAVATDSNLKITKNGVYTSLRSSARAADTVISVAACSNIEANMLLTLSRREIVNVVSVGSNCALTVTRSFDSTTAVDHAGGAEVASFQTAWERNVLKKEIQAIQTALGANLANINASNAVSATSYDWTKVLGTVLIAGVNSVSLSGGCPSGVAGTNVTHKMKLTGGGAADEYVTITGGTCTSGASSGTVIFTAANIRSGTGTIGSATAGIREAIAVLGASGGRVTIPAGTYTVCGVDTSLIPVIIEGAGLGSTILSCDSTTLPVITLRSSYAVLREFRVKHDVSALATLASTARGIETANGGTDYALIERVEATQNYDGIFLSLVTMAVLQNSFANYNTSIGIRMDPAANIWQWTLAGNSSSLNGSHAYSLYTEALDANGNPVTVAAPRMYANNAYLNGGACIYVDAKASHAISGLKIQGGFIGNCNSHGIYLNSRGNQIDISDVHMEYMGRASGTAGYRPTTVLTPSDAGYGIWITANNAPSKGGIQVHGNNINGSTLAGILSQAPSVISNNIITASGYRSPAVAFASEYSATYHRAGIAALANDVKISGNDISSPGGTYTKRCIEIADALATTAIGENECDLGSVFTRYTFTVTPTSVAPASFYRRSERFGATTATAASAGAVADTTFTWTEPMPSANYTANCTLAGAFTGVPVPVGVVSKTATQFVFRVMAGTAVAASAPAAHCTAFHD